MKSFVFWNNKGGVGKTMLTWLTATNYAYKNPDKKIILVDMCPQANLSEIALGGKGDGEANLEGLTNNKRTISDYIASRLGSPFDTFASASAKLSNYNLYLNDISSYNKNFNSLPKNIYLIAGNSDLDFQSKSIEFLANSADALNQPEIWKTIKSWIKDLLLIIDMNQKDCIFFIDCNPSFSAYTEMAIIAGTDLIIPCTADGASSRALSNLMKLIYGISISSGVSIPSIFNSRVMQHKINLPKISLIVQNRNRRRPNPNSLASQGQGVQAKAYQGIMDEIENKAKQYQNNAPSIFLKTKDLVIEVKDCNTLAPIISYNGLPLVKIENKTYSVYEMQVQTEQKQINMITSGIEELTAKI